MHTPFTHFKRIYFNTDQDKFSCLNQKLCIHYSSKPMPKDITNCIGDSNGNPEVFETETKYTRRRAIVNIYFSAVVLSFISDSSSRSYFINST